jgi:hypothetical protein
MPSTAVTTVAPTPISFLPITTTASSANTTLSNLLAQPITSTALPTISSSSTIPSFSIPSATTTGATLGFGIPATVTTTTALVKTYLTF